MYQLGIQYEYNSSNERELGSETDASLETGVDFSNYYPIEHKRDALKQQTFQIKACELLLSQKLAGDMYLDR